MCVKIIYFYVECASITANPLQSCWVYCYLSCNAAAVLLIERSVGCLSKWIEEMEDGWTSSNFIRLWVCFSKWEVNWWFLVFCRGCRWSERGATGKKRFTSLLTLQAKWPVGPNKTDLFNSELNSQLGSTGNVLFLRNPTYFFGPSFFLDLGFSP